MRIITLNEIRGNEILAKDIISDSGYILIHSGSIIKKDYIQKLKDLSIEFLYVQDKISEGIDLFDNLELKIKEELQNSFKETIDKFINQSTKEISRIEEIVNKVINNILEDENVVYSLNSIRNKNESIYSHSLNVCVLAVIIGTKLELSDKKINNLGIAGLLHDIGLSYVNFDYKSIDYNDMTKKQQNKLNNHVIYSYEIVKKIDSISGEISDIILRHHEKLDGSGYPFKIKSDRISIESRILCVCDEFDIMIYGDSGRKVAVSNVLDYMISQADIKYDLKVIDTLIGSVAAYPTGCLVSTSRGQRAIVMRQNHKCPTRPIIRILNEEYLNNKWQEIDLTKDLTLFIEEIIEESID